MNYRCNHRGWISLGGKEKSSKKGVKWSDSCVETVEGWNSTKVVTMANIAPFDMLKTGVFDLKVTVSKVYE